MRFFRRRRPAGGESPAAAGAQPLPPSVAFDALTEEWRLVGVMEVQGRLSDTLNRRQPIPISAVSWAPIDDSGPFAPVGLRSVDPYELIVVLGARDSLPDLDDRQRAAYKLHKVAYDVALDCPPVRVVGTVHLLPGNEPDRILERHSELFIPVTDAVTFVDARRVGDTSAVALVNRSYIKRVEQIDRRTYEAVRPLPGRPLGGTSHRTP